MEKNTNIRELVIEQLGDEPSEHKIKEVAENTKISPILIQQWLKFSKKNQSKKDDINSSQYEIMPKFNGRFDNTQEEHEDAYYEKQIIPQKNIQYRVNHEQMVIKNDVQQKNNDKEIKQKKKVQKVEKKQLKNILEFEDREEISKLPNIQEKYVNVPIYYMIKLEESLMEQAMNIHQKLVKIIESRYDYLSLL